MLILCPREFVEFRGSKPSIDYHYTGPSIDPQRKEPEFPWERLDAERPLVMFSLGTMVIQSEQARRFHQSVIEAARRRPRWQFVVATNQWKEETPGQAPANLVAVKHVPQLQMLRRASAMVTHGGFNSVKECIYFGVPMVVLPVQYDQPGMAARVVHHGLGVRAAINELTPDTLVPLLDEVPALSGDHAPAGEHPGHDECHVLHPPGPQAHSPAHGPLQGSAALPPGTARARARGAVQHPSGPGHGLLAGGAQPHLR